MLQLASRFGARHAVRFIVGVAASAVTLTIGTPQLSAQGPGRDGPMTARSHRMFGFRARGPHRAFAGSMSDPAARLLDRQAVLQLTGTQVDQLIAIHERTRRQMRAVRDKLQTLVPHRDGNRTQPSAAQRDSLASLMDSMREIRWRATSAADSVLTPDQRKDVARFEMAQMSRMHGMGMPGMRGMHGSHGMRGGMRGGMPGAGHAPDSAGAGPGDDQF